MNNAEVYYNPFQLKVALLQPRELTVIGGRAVGKSTRIIAHRTTECALAMEGSTNGIIAKNNVQNLTRIMPAVTSGWRDLGFIEGVHWTYGKADKALRFLEPAVKPMLWERTLHFFNGAIFPLVSQERRGNAAGYSFQSLHGDEAWMLKYDELKEGAFPAMRGLAKYENLVHYKMKTFTSSMPVTPQGGWLFEAEQQMDEEGLELMWQLIHDMQSLDQNGRLYAEYAKMLHTLRMRNPIYLETSSFDNIDVLRPEYFTTAFRDLDPLTFKTQIMNIRPTKVENSFYPNLTAKNFYEADYNASHYDSLAMNEFTDDEVHSLGDNDCMHQSPLILSIDWGGNINSMVVAQEDLNTNTIRIIKEFYVTKPEYILHLVKKFAQYYRYHGERVIRLYYDRNGKSPVGNSAETYADYATRLFYEQNWVVIDMEQGDDNPDHSDKFEFFKILFGERDKRLPKVLINEDNCANLRISMERAETKVTTGRVEKNKNSERSAYILPQHATHLSDAIDYLLYRKYRKVIDYNIAFMGMI
jgi:hypothetical protein